MVKVNEQAGDMIWRPLPTQVVRWATVAIELHLLMDT